MPSTAPSRSTSTTTALVAISTAGGSILVHEVSRRIVNRVCVRVKCGSKCERVASSLPAFSKKRGSQLRSGRRCRVPSEKFDV